MKNIIELIHKRKKAAAFLTVAFLCVVGGMIYTISKPVSNQLDQSNSSSVAASSSVKVKVVDITPASSSASGASSSKSPAQTVDIKDSNSKKAAEYKPETAQPGTGSVTHNQESTTETSASNPTVVSVKQIKAPDQLKIMVGESIPIDIQFLPENATDKKVVWESSKESIAKVDKTGMVTGIAAGSCTVTVQTAFRKIQSSITITVSAKEGKQ